MCEVGGEAWGLPEDSVLVASCKLLAGKDCESHRATAFFSGTFLCSLSLWGHRLCYFMLLKQGQDRGREMAGRYRGRY